MARKTARPSEQFHPSLHQLDEQVLKARGDVVPLTLLRSESVHRATNNKDSFTPAIASNGYLLLNSGS